MTDQNSQRAAELLRSDLGVQAREAHLDALIADPQALRALRLAMRLEPAADTLVAQLQSTPAKRSWLGWLNGWNLGGLTAASAAAAVMLLAPAPTHQGPEVRPAPTPQLLAGDVLTSASFEPSASFQSGGELFGGDFEG